MDQDSLSLAMEKSGLDIRKFFNSSGKAYRERNLKEVVGGLSIKEAAKIISEDSMLLKRPLLIDEDRVVVGFSEEDYKSLIEDLV